jgi:putative ABC transport system ATP-binding protein
MVDVKKVYLLGSSEIKALRGISLEIQPHEFISVMGPSGSGKSTLMNIIGFLDRPTCGSYRFEDKEVSQVDDDRLAHLRNTRIGFVFQTFNLMPRYSALKNVELPLIYSGIPPRERRERAMTMLGEVGLYDRLHHKPSEMSGGEQQRVAIARALVNHPAILLADEPTGNLDSKSGSEIIDIFIRLNEKGTTLIVVTHNRDIALHSKRILYVLDGQLVDEERPG